MQIVIDIENKPISDYVFAISVDENATLIYQDVNIFDIASSGYYYIFVKNKITSIVEYKSKKYIECLNNEEICPVDVLDTISISEAECPIFVLNNIELDSTDSGIICVISVLENIPIVECDITVMSNIELDDDEVDPDPEPIDGNTILLYEVNLYKIKNNNLFDVYVNYEDANLEDNQIKLIAGQEATISMSGESTTNKTFTVIRNTGSTVSSGVVVTYAYKGFDRINQFGGYPLIDSNGIWTKRIDLHYDEDTCIVTNKSTYKPNNGSVVYYKVNESAYTNILEADLSGLKGTIVTITALFLNTTSPTNIFWEAKFVGFVAA